jgi:predicted component of type VI protein secretion system
MSAMVTLALLFPAKAARRMSFDGSEIAIGRAGDNDLVIEHDSVGRRHCRITYRDGEYYVEDTHSPCGIWVNNEKCMGPVLLRDLDLLQIGMVVLRVLIGAESARREALVAPVPRGHVEK